MARVLVGGRPVEGLDGLRLNESLQDGSRLVLAMAGDLRIEPGDPVDLEINVDTGAGPLDARLRLWCCGVSRQSEGSGRVHTEVRAADPLVLCEQQIQFRTFQGKRSLAGIAQDVIANQPGRLDGLQWAQGPAKTIRSEWLFQAEETGRGFLRRLGSCVDQVVFWSRDRFCFGDLGSGLSSPDPGTIEVAFGRDLLQLQSTCAGDLQSQSLHSIDPNSRETRTTEFRGSGPARSADRTLTGRTPGWSGTQFAPSERGESAFEGATWSALTARPDITLGSALAVSGDPGSGPAGEMLVEEIEHWIDRSDSYSNRVVCVPRNRWALRGRQLDRAPIGPYQAHVTHNADPAGLGRVRVVIHGDPDARPSHWIPLVAPYGGRETAMQWLPEVRDRILVVGEPGMPESLYCLGVIRGKSEKVKPAWESSGNAIKILEVRQGLRLVFHDQEGWIRLETQGCSLQLDNDGKVKLSGKEITIDASASARMTAGQRLAFDAQRIDLG
jgi:hypothetical protein